MSSAPSFLARRLSFKGRAAKITIAVSFTVMIVAVAITAGFRKEIRKGLAELSGDMLIAPYTGIAMGMPGSEGMKQERCPVDSLAALPCMESVTPVIYTAGIVKKGDNVHSVIFKGIPTADSASMKVLIPSALAKILDLKAGDSMVSYFVGERTVVRNFNVSRVTAAIMPDNDRMIVWCDIHTLRRILKWEEDECSAVEAVFKDEYRGEEQEMEMVEEIQDALFRGDEHNIPLICSRVEELYPSLFDWLCLIDNNVMFILAMMIVVAAFNMIIALLILLFESISEIGLLKSMGMYDSNIMLTFLKASLSNVASAAVWGNVVAIVLCLLESAFKLIPLNPENYFIDYVPASLNIPVLLVCDLAGILMIMLILLVPCRFILKVDPAKTMKME